MSWVIYLLISIILISFNGLFHRSILKDDSSSPQAQMIAFLGLDGFIAVLLALFQGKLNLNFPLFLFWNFIILIILLTPAYLCKYRAYQLIGASEVVVFSVTGRLWNIIGAVFFLGEKITIQIIFGAILILAGVMISRYEKGEFTFNKGLLLVLFSAFLFGMGDINGYYILKNYDSTNYLIYSSYLPVIALLLLQPDSYKKLKYYYHKVRFAKILLLSLFDSFGMLFLFLAYQNGGKASIISPLRATSIILTTVLAIIILKEKDNVKNKLVGVFVAVIGVILLI